MALQRLLTQRLTLRRWSEADVEPYSKICGDADVMRWIGSGRVQTEQECRDAISDFESFWDARGFGLFALERQDTKELVGFAGLSIPNFLPEVLPAIEIGWRLGSSAWGVGYAAEAAKAVLDFGLNELGLPRIVSIYQIGNEASERIMQKIGMTFEREATDETCGRRVRVYEVLSPS